MKNSAWRLQAAASLLMLAQSMSILAAGPEVTWSNGDVTVSSTKPLLSIGDTVKTGSSGEAALQMNESGLRVRISPDSEVSYQGLTPTGAQNFKVTKGRVQFSIVPGNHLDVETPHLVASVRGTEFSTTVDTQTSELSVSEGRVAIHDSKGGAGTVARGWSAVATAAGFTAQTNARLSMMSSPRAEGASIEKERVEKAEGAGKSDAGRVGAAESDSKSDGGGDSGKGGAGGNASNSSTGGSSSSSSSGNSGSSSSGNSGGKGSGK